MGRLTIFCILLAVLFGARAGNRGDLGPSNGSTVVVADTDSCAGGVLFHNHDGSFEYAYTWGGSGVAPPYYGAFGEGYDRGPGTVVCASLWLTTLPGFIPPPTADCYVWDSGVDTPPGTVLGLLVDVPIPQLYFWPAVSQIEVPMNITVSGPFTVGYWGPWPGGEPLYYCAVDLDGPGGHPWTCIAPGIGYASGWQDPSIVWGPTASIGCGVYFDRSPTPAEGETWGGIKAIFRAATR